METVGSNKQAGGAGGLSQIAFRAIGTMVSLAGIIEELERDARALQALREGRVIDEQTAKKMDAMECVLVRTNLALQNAASFANAELLASYLDPQWAEAVTETVKRVEAAAGSNGRRGNGCRLIFERGTATINEDAAKAACDVPVIFGIGGAA